MVTKLDGPRSERLRRVHADRQSDKRRGERAIAALHQRPTGPAVTSVAEVQPAPVRPRIRVPGS
jgi:hypothetical protein